MRTSVFPAQALSNAVALHEAEQGLAPAGLERAIAEFRYAREPHCPAYSLANDRSGCPPIPSASSISAMNQRLDESLAQFAGRPLGEAFPC